MSFKFNLKYYFNYVVPLAIGLAMSHDMQAQQMLTTSELLKDRSSDSINVVLDRSIDYLKNSNQKMPVVDKYEFRTETDELDIKRQEYLFRTSFTGSKERKILQSMILNDIEKIELKKLINDSKLIADRYEALVDWYFAQRKLELIAAEEIILNDKLKVFQKMLSTATEINLDNILKAEEDLQELKMDRYKLNRSIQMAQNQIGLPAGEYFLDTENWITPEEMKTQLSSGTPEVPSIEMNYQQNQIDEAKLEYEMEAAAGKQLLDFVQLKYSGREKLEFNKELSLGIGITIPTKASTRVKMNESMLDIYEENYQAEELKREFILDLAKEMSEFNRIIDEYSFFQTQTKEIDLDEVYRRYSNTGAVHPLTLLNLKDRIIQQEDDKLKLEKQACIHYLEVLDIRGLLYSKPNTNFLAK